MLLRLFAPSRAFLALNEAARAHEMLHALAALLLAFVQFRARAVGLCLRGREVDTLL